MSYEISVGLLQDVTRITTIPQNLMMVIESYNHSILETPPVPLTSPSWDFNYSFVGSEKQIISIQLCSLHVDTYMKVLARGKLDFRDYVARHQPSNSFKLKLPLDSQYNNEVLLHLRCQHSSEQHSRNDGLKLLRSPGYPRTSSQTVPRKNGIFNNPRSVVSKTDTEPFFKGSCQTRNFFSFLDPVLKGQSYNFIEPTKKM